MLKEQGLQEKILFVDDDTSVLDGIRRALRNSFSIETALGGEAGLEALADRGPFAVVVSDLKMPKMDGVEFLSRVREHYPDTVRMVLTGYAELELAVNAVNKGHIFRFLTKPCDKDCLGTALQSGLDQFRMLRSSRELEVMKRIKQGLEGTLLAFTHLLESRDPYTAGHMHRVAKIAIRIATKLGLEENTIQGLYYAALVHDIGKVAVPAGILNKPGQLGEAEHALIRTHPEVGWEVFSNIDMPWPVARIILEHHERIDGTGYPHGLKGDEMLLESKILAVADVIDASMSHRPYRQALGKQRTIDILKTEWNGRLDRQVVEKGLEVLEEGLEGYESS